MTEVARGEIHIEVEDREALADLRRIEAEYERTMRSIDRQEATVDIKGDIDDLKRKAKEAEQVVKDYDKRIQAAENARSKAALERYRKEAQARADAAKKDLEAGRARLSAEKKKQDALRITEARVEAVQKREEARARALAAADKRRLAALRAEQREQERLARMQERDERIRERIATKAARDAARAAEARQREIDAIPKMQRRYVELAGTLERLQAARRKARGDKSAVQAVDIKQADVENDMRILRERLERIGSPVNLDVNIHPGRALGASFREIARDRGVRSAGAALGATLGASAAHSFADKFRPSSIMAAGARGFSRFGSLLSGFQNMTVRLGPFTATIRQAFVALSLFAPVLLDVVGALGALVGVAGGAAVGVGALGAAIAGGAGPAFLGMGLVIKDVVQEFQAVKKATKAYQDAVMKNADTVPKKLAELKATLGNVSDETAKQVASAQDLGKAWDKATKPAHASVWKAIGQAIQTGSDLMPMFAKNTNEAMDMAQKGVSRWMKALRSPEGRAALDEMMDNFNASLGPVLNGLGNVVAYLGRVGRIASRSLPGLAKSFESWSEALLHSSDNAGTLSEKVNGVIDDARTVGRFLMAAGRAAKAFFGAGREGGTTMLTDMTNALDRWTISMQGAGRSGLVDFFNESVRGAQALYAVLAPVISSFVGWAAAIAPFVRSFMGFSSAVADAVSQLLRMTALSGPLSALATTLGVLWGVGRISTATRAIAGFTSGLVGMERAGQRAAAATSLAVNAPGSGRRALGAVPVVAPAAAANAEKAAAATSRFGRAASAARGAMTGLVSAVGLLARSNAPLLVAGLGYAIYQSATRTSEYTKATKEANEAAQNWGESSAQVAPTISSLAQTTLGARSAALRLRDAQREVTRLQRAGKTRTDEYTYAQLNLQDAQQQAAINEQNIATLRQATAQAQTKAMRDVTAENKAAADAVSGLTDRNTDAARAAAVIKERMGVYGESLAEATEYAHKLQEEQSGMFDSGIMHGVGDDDINMAVAAMQRFSEAQKNLHRQQELTNLNNVNMKRAMRGLIPMADSAARALTQISKLGGKNLQTKISLKFSDPKDAERVAKSAAARLKGGVPKNVVTRIVGDSKSAEEAVRRLQRLKITPKTVKIIEQGGRRAMAMLNDLVGKKLAPKVQKIMASDRDAVSKMRALIAAGVPPKVVAFLGNAMDAERKQRQINSFKANPVVQFIGRIIQNPPGLFAALRPVVQFVRRVITGDKRAEGGFAYAAGTPAMGAPPNARQQDRAARTADLAGVRTTRGGKTRGPRYLVGEEPGHPEIIIATNPRYRKRNQEYAKLAARAVGLKLASDEERRYATGGVNYGGKFDKKTQEFSPTATLKRNKKFKPTKKRRAALKSNRSWAAYIESLQTQQSNWEREVSIRESQVVEPTDTIIEGPSKKVIDPSTGKEVEVKTYVPNEAAINTYKQQLVAVMQAMDTLLGIVRELVRAIPQAILANQQERSLRRANIENLQDKIEKEKDKKAKADKEDKPKHQARIDKWQAVVDDEKQEIGTLKDDEKQLVQDRVDAGFDVREISIARAKLQDDHDKAHPNAEAEATKASEGELPGAGGTGGGDTTPPGLSVGGDQGEAMATAMSEMNSALQQFGNNFVTGGAAAGAYGGGPAGGGAQVNPASLLAGMGGAGGSVAADLTAAGMFGGATSGGAAAAQMLQSSPGTTIITATTDANGTPDSGEGGRTIIFNQTFEQQQDPHTFVKGVEFEVNTAL